MPLDHKAIQQRAVLAVHRRTLEVELRWQAEFSMPEPCRAVNTIEAVCAQRAT
jgi:hypothetical protein